MTLLEIAKHRLHNHQIGNTDFTTVVEMVSWFGAVQAQEYTQAKWGLGLRLPDLQNDDIEKDFTEGKILRTHLLRPTWHFVTAQDIRWMLLLTAPRVHSANAFMYRQLELDTTLFKRCNRILINTMQGGRQLTRDALNEEFKRKKITAVGHRLSYIMMQAELDGIICNGAREGSQFTYSLLEERVPLTQTKTKDEALAELTKRYFTSRGPATIADFSTWSGLTLAECRKGIAMVQPKFAAEVIQNETYYFSTAISLSTKEFKSICLLPVYDEYIMGYKNRDAILQIRKHIKPVPDFSFSNTIIYNGQIIGTWKRIIKKNSIDLTYEFFMPPTKMQIKAFKNTIKRLEEFTGLKVEDKAIEL